MQKMGQNGYTDAEVEDELRFGRGFNSMSFRYDLLDFQNQYLRPLTNVTGCTVKQDYTGDIKLQATLEMVDDPTIDYLNNRVKPWVRLALPADSRDFTTIANQYLGGMTAKYDLDETSGTTAFDSSPIAAHNGTIGSLVVLNQAGVSQGSSMSFPGSTLSTGIITINNGSDFFNKAAAPGKVTNAFAVSVWVSPNIDPVSQVVFRTAGAEASLAFDASGNVVFTCNSATGATKVTTSPNPYGRDIRHIMVSWSIGSLPTIYLNGQAPPAQVKTGEPNSLMTAGSAVVLQVGYSFQGKIDSLMFLNVGVSADRVNQLYRSGAHVGPFGKSNYAEWPQGVYLISSPSRSLSNADVVTRSIEAFDQAEVLTDDITQTRYVAPIGSLYMNDILSLLFAYRTNDLLLWSPTWKKVNATSTPPIGAIPTLQTGFVTDPTVAGLANGFTTGFNYSVANLSFVASRVSFLDSNLQERYRFYIDTNNYTEMLNSTNSAGTQTTTIFNQVINGVTTATQTVVGVTTTMANQFKITESNGVTTFWLWDLAHSTFVPILTAASLPYLSRGRLSAEIVALSAGTVSSPSQVGVGVQAAVWQQVNATPTNAFLPTSKEYGPGTSKLSIINDLLDAIAYDHIFYDENGVAVLRPYTSPSVMPIEFEYADNSVGVVFPGNMVQTLDLFKVPNTWIGTATSPDGTSFSNANNPKVNASLSSPTSTVNRHRTITKVMTNISETPDLATLLAFLDKVAEQDSQVYESVTFQSAIIPIHTNRNILSIKNQPLGISDKYEETGWSFEMKEGAAMSHTVRKFVDIS